jgi:hypothetical protein
MKGLEATISTNVQEIQLWARPQASNERPEIEY